MKLTSVQELISRYLILLLVAIPNLYLFYLIFTPLTVYPVYIFFSLILETTLLDNIIIINNIAIELIKSCIAGSAYYLLLILNLAIPNIKLAKRIKMISFAFATFLIFNIIRIIILSWMALNTSDFFAITHKLTWYFLSVILVVGIWFSEVKIFKIKEIPFFTDIKFLYKFIK